MARKIDTKKSGESHLHYARWWPPHVTSKRLTIVLSALAVLVICTYGGLVLYHKLVVRDGPSPDSNTVFSDDQLGAYAKYNDLVKDGRYEDAAKYIDTMPITDGAKVSLHQSLEQVSTGYDKQVADIKYRESNGQMTAGDAQELGEIYYQRGDKTQADFYYQKAIVLYKKMPQTLDVKLEISGMEDRLNEK